MYVYFYIVFIYQKKILFYIFVKFAKLQETFSRTCATIFYYIHVFMCVYIYNNCWCVIHLDVHWPIHVYFYFLHCHLCICIHTIIIEKYFSSFGSVWIFFLLIYLNLLVLNEMWTAKKNYSITEYDWHSC